MQLTQIELMKQFLKYKKFCEMVEIIPNQDGFLTWYENQLRGVN